MLTAEQRYEDAFAGDGYQDGEAQAEEQDIPITFFLGKIILEVVADETTRQGHEGIGDQAVGHGDTQRQSKSHQQDRLQESPYEPPGDEDEEEFCDGEG